MSTRTGDHRPDPFLFSAFFCFFVLVSSRGIQGPGLFAIVSLELSYDTLLLLGSSSGAVGVYPVILLTAFTTCIQARKACPLYTPDYASTLRYYTV